MRCHYIKYIGCALSCLCVRFQIDSGHDTVMVLQEKENIYNNKKDPIKQQQTKPRVRKRERAGTTKNCNAIQLGKEDILQYKLF